jgi:osmotically inducible protein OsmC
MQLAKAAPGGLVRRNGIVLQPVAARKLIKIRARADGLIESGSIESDLAETSPSKKKRWKKSIERAKGMIPHGHTTNELRHSLGRGSGGVLREFLYRHSTSCFVYRTVLSFKCIAPKSGTARKWWQTPGVPAIYNELGGGFMKRQASAEWRGDLKGGKGTISTGSGVLQDTQYSFGTRFEEGKGTNPEELIAAAHAGCFAMALSAQLGQVGLTAESLKATATVSLENISGGWAVTSSHLDLRAKIPGADAAKFEEAANKAKEGCPISKLLNAKVTMDAKLE